MSRDLSAEVLVDDVSDLGEGPVWDADRNRLIWLDIPGQRLMTWHAADGHVSGHVLPRRITYVNPTTTGALVIAGDRQVGLADADGGGEKLLTDLPVADDASTNDGAVDPQGRLWIGATNAARDPAVGMLLRVEGDGTTSELRRGITLSNGIDWSPDGTIAYHVDTFARRVDRLTLDDHGDIVDTNLFLATSDLPDGLAVDAEGGVWIAFWDSACVRRYTPDGTLDTTVTVGSGKVTSCAFGPSGSTELYITTARQGMTPDELAALPESGALFRVDVGIGGRGVHAFAG